MANSTTPYKIIIGALVLMLVAISMHSYTHKKAADHFKGHIEKYPLLDSALPFYDRENLVVNIQELRDYLNGLPEQNKDWAEMSIYFEVLSTGANASVNNDVKLPPASLSKLPMGMIAMKKVEKGEWTMETEFTVREETIGKDNDPRFNQKVGDKLLLKVLLERLLTYSDNTAYHMIVSELKDAELISIAEEVGLDEFFTTAGKISAKDYTRFFRSLHSATYLNLENSQYILNLLTMGDFEKFLHDGTPKEVPIAHKWGINEQHNVYADSGIIYNDNRHYMLSVIIQGKSEDKKSDQLKAELLIKDIASHSYEFMSK